MNIPKIQMRLDAMIRIRTCDRQEKIAKDVLISNHLFEIEHIQKALTICCYISFPREVDTKKVIKILLFHQKKVLEPKEDTDAEIFIIPGLAFDRRGNRLGRGGGFYDRLLAKTKATKIALAYDIQIVDEIPADTHDVPMDFIVTEKQIYSY